MFAAPHQKGASTRWSGMTRDKACLKVLDTSVLNSRILSSRLVSNVGVHSTKIRDDGAECRRGLILCSKILKMEGEDEGREG